MVSFKMMTLKNSEDCDSCSRELTDIKQETMAHRRGEKSNLPVTGSDVRCFLFSLFSQDPLCVKHMFYNGLQPCVITVSLHSSV